jgi:hypothetical protein
MHIENKIHFHFMSIPKQTQISFQGINPLQINGKKYGIYFYINLLHNA